MSKFVLLVLAAVISAPAVVWGDQPPETTPAVLGNVIPGTRAAVAGQPLLVSIVLQNYSSQNQVVRYFPPQTMVQLCVWKKNGAFQKPGERGDVYIGHVHVFTVDLPPGKTWRLRWESGTGEISAFDTRIWGYRFDHPGEFALSAVYAGLTEDEPAELCPESAPPNATLITIKPKDSDD